MFFVCHPCTPPELKIIQVKHKDHSHCHVLNYIHLEYTMPGLGPFLNNEIIQGMAYLSSTLALLKKSSISYSNVSFKCQKQAFSHF